MATMNLIKTLGRTKKYIFAKLAEKAQKALADEDGNNIKTTYYQKPASGIPVVGLESPASLGGYAAPTNVMAVDSMPAAADRDPTTVYLVVENTNAS